MAEEFCVIIEDHDFPTEIKLECSSIEAATEFADEFNSEKRLKKGTWVAQPADKIVFVSKFANPNKQGMTDYVESFLNFIGIEPRRK